MPHSSSEIARNSRLSQQKYLSSSSLETRNGALLILSSLLQARSSDISCANALDLESAAAMGLDAATSKRLVLDAAKIAALVVGLKEIVALVDPLHQCTLFIESCGQDSFYSDLRAQLVSSA